MLTRTLMGAAAAVFLLCAPVKAAVITFDVLSASWSHINAQANANESTGHFGDIAWLRWGQGNRSGYNFNPTNAPFSIPEETNFQLGRFTHINRAINTGSALLSAVLNITANVTINGQPGSPGPITFSLTHNETPNNCFEAGCAADKVTLSSVSMTDKIQVGGLNFMLTT